MTTKVVLLCGPPGSGKDESARLLVHSLQNACHKEMKSALHACVMQHFNISPELWRQLCEREHKETPQVCLGGRSPRQAQIYVSEQLIKPTYGDGYFALKALEDFESGKINVVSDSGFSVEADVMCSHLGAENVLIVRLSRNGTSFANDSRSYIHDSRCRSIDIANNASTDELCLVLLAAVLNFLN